MEKGVHVVGKGAWGYCTPDCKQAEGETEKVKGADDYDYDEYELDVCLTTQDSKNPDKECIFPFTHDNFTYYGCPIDPLDKTKRWCSINIDENGVHVNGDDNWGYCTASGCNVYIHPGNF